MSNPSASSHPLSYWYCQLIGWGLACCYWIFTMIDCDCMPFWRGTANIVVTFVTVIGITHTYRWLAHRYGWRKLGLKALIPVVIIGMLSLSAAFWFVNLFINYYSYPSNKEMAIGAYLANSIYMFMAGVRLMSIWILAYHLYHFARRSAEAEKEKILSEKIAVDASLANLHTQLQPHFLFNALNSVNALILDEPAKAKHALILLSHLLRNSLNISEKKMIPLQEELDYIKDYLQIEKIRFEDRLTIKWEIDSQLLHHPILPLSIQVLVENALKHGISNLIEGGTVAIHISQQENHMHISVTNPGTLTYTNEHKGIGLENLKQRLALTYDEEASITLTNTETHLVVASMIIPLRYE